MTSRDIYSHMYAFFLCALCVSFSVIWHDARKAVAHLFGAVPRFYVCSFGMCGAVAGRYSAGTLLKSD